MNLSVITINYNNLAGLQKTMQSVFEQCYTDYEYIIIDGGSTDGSKEYIQLHTDKLAYWVCEKDTGIFNAMNKGIRQAKGEYLFFLNSGDFLISTDSLLSFFKLSKGEDIVSAQILVSAKGHTWVKSSPATLSFSFFIKDTLPHQSTIIKKNLFEKIGYYKEDQKIMSDWEFFLHAICLHQASYKFIAYCVSEYNTEGFSSRPENFELFCKEKDAILHRYYPAFLQDYVSAVQFEAELNRFKNSRSHMFVESISEYQFFKLIKKYLRKLTFLEINRGREK